jgi:hypothetical protein
MAFNSQRFPAPSKKIPVYADDDAEEYDSEIKNQKRKIVAKTGSKREEAGKKSFEDQDSFQHKASKFKGQAAKVASDKRETQKESHEELPSEITIALESDTKRQLKLLTSAILELCDVLGARKSL